MKDFFHKYHSSIFACIIVFSLQLALYLLITYGILIYITAILFTFIIFLIEASFSYTYAKDAKAKLPLPYIIDDIKHIHISQHILLPFLLYIAECFFLFFNRFSLQSELTLIIAGVTFFSIFEGQRFSFSHEFSFDDVLHYIYDAIKLIIYFLSVDCLLQAKVYWGLSTTIIFILLEAIIFILLILIIARKGQLNIPGIIYMFFVSLGVACITVFGLIYLPAFTTSLISSVLLYLCIGIIHHKINASLSFQVVIEYLLIAIIIFLALRGIS